MRKLRENQPNRVYRLISRIAHRAFYLNAAERDRFVDLLPRLCSVLLWGAVVGIASVSAADAFPNFAQAGGNAGSAVTLEFHALAHPDSVLLDGRDAGRRVSVSDDGRVVLDGGTASFVEIMWAFPLGGKTRVLGGQWERTYGDVGWRPVKDAQSPRGGSMPWYLLVTDGTRTDGYGVQVQPNAFASWQASPKGLRLLLDVRAGSSPVELGSRRLELCRLVARRGQAGETPFAAGRAFCRLMCPVSRLPKKPVYGYNDWYCAYGRNTATNFLADAESLVGFMRAAGGADPANPPFAVADDGWQLKDSCGDRPGPEGQWTGSNPRWNMPMDTFCARVRKLGARPGVWYRPLMPWKTMPESWKTRGRAAAIWKEGDFTIDPTAPGLADRIRSEMARFRSWGVELVKIDYITYDWNTHWGFDLGERVIDHDAAVWQDRSRTGAETILGLYRAMREGAGDMLVIGCNAIDHFAAGLFELQRTGDDTSGLEWARTRKMGPNTLGMRAIHNNIFYQCDGDCVGLVKEGDVPWDKNRQWLELVAASGTSLFTSWKRGNARTEDVRLALGRAWARASRATETAEPLDWLETLRPAVWKTMYGKLRFDWDVKPIGF